MKKLKWIFITAAAVILFIAIISIGDEVIVTKTEKTAILNKAAQSLFLGMTKGKTHGPVLSFIPDTLIEECRQQAANIQISSASKISEADKKAFLSLTPEKYIGATAEEMNAYFASLCKALPAYTNQRINDSIAKNGQSDDIDDYFLEIKEYVNKEYAKRNR